MKLLTYLPFSLRPSNILSTPKNFCISKLFSVLSYDDCLFQGIIKNNSHAKFWG